MSIQLTPDLEQRLNQMATALNRTANDLVEEAMNGYVNHITSLAAQVREGEESAERVGWLTHNDVFERLNQRSIKTAERAFSTQVSI